ncbi:hypothetical protein AAVH_38749, partial [Aphelenchoides avenae]
WFLMDGEHVDVKLKLYLDQGFHLSRSPQPNPSLSLSLPAEAAVEAEVFR